MDTLQRPAWKPALLLGAAGAFACALLIPYVMALMPKLRLLPMSRLMLSASAEGALLVFGAAWAGLRMGAAVGLGAPYLRAWVDRAAPRPPRAHWWQATLLGVTAGALIVAFDVTLFGAQLTRASADGRLRGLLASFYGGIVEETLLRLFVMTAIVRLAMLVTGARALTTPIAVTAIVLATLLFGVGHLPAAAQLAPLTTVAVVRVLLLNGLAGLACGWLYWRRGLEHAMVAHFAADLVLHVLVGG